MYSRRKYSLIGVSGLFCFRKKKLFNQVLKLYCYKWLSYGAQKKDASFLRSIFFQRIILSRIVSNNLYAMSLTNKKHTPDHQSFIVLISVPGFGSFIALIAALQSSAICWVSS